MQPGRSCPLGYRYSPQVFARAPEIHADTLYVIGGLYGNVPALEALLELAARERATLVFNGDFNWFNIDDAAFQAINTEVLRHHALRGNVETEISSEDDAASNGCGCAYPDYVSDDDVARSNAISLELRATARRHLDLRARLAVLPMHRVAEVGGTRAAIVHGDLESLAGWALAQDNLAHSDNKNIVLNQILTSTCPIVASSHTCLPVALQFDTSAGTCAVFNNGAAGMPNFRDTHYGVITRIATTPVGASVAAPLYGTRINGVYVDALPLAYDPVRWEREFLAQWPPGSAACLSYHQRMMHGPAYSVREANRLAVSNKSAARPTVIA